MINVSHEIDNCYLKLTIDLLSIIQLVGNLLKEIQSISYSHRSIHTLIALFIMLSSIESIEKEDSTSLTFKSNLSFHSF